LGKRELSKKRESVGKSISLFRSFHTRMDHILHRRFEMSFDSGKKAAIGLVALMLVLASPYSFSFGWSLKEVAKPYRGQTIRIIGEALAPLHSLVGAKGEFEEVTGIKVKIEERAFDMVIQKTTADFAARTGIYDAVLQPPQTIGKLLGNDWVYPLDDIRQALPELVNPELKLEESVVSKWWLEQAYKRGGKLYGVPFSAHTEYLNWRVDLFENPAEQKAFKEKYGYELPAPPITMDQLRDSAEFFTRKKGEMLAGKVLDHDFYGITLCGKRHISTVWNFLSMAYAFSAIDWQGQRGTDYGTSTINSPEMAEALEFYKDLITKFAPSGSLTYTWDEQLAALQTGIAAMAVLWGDASYMVSMDPKESKVTGRVNYSGTPIKYRKTSNYHLWGFYISRFAKHKEAAWLFLQWATTPKITAMLMKHGAISLYKAAYEDPSVQKLPYAATNYFIVSNGKIPVWNGKPAFREKGSDWGLPKEYAEAQDPLTGNRAPIPFKLLRVPEADTINDIYSLYISGYLIGKYPSAKEALDKCAAEIKNKWPEKFGGPTPRSYRAP
jgi:multiple sugar transport system substrate-binding protein